MGMKRDPIQQKCPHSPLALQIEGVETEFARTPNPGEKKEPQEAIARLRFTASVTKPPCPVIGVEGPWPHSDQNAMVNEENFNES